MIIYKWVFESFFFLSCQKKNHEMKRLYFLPVILLLLVSACSHNTTTTVRPLSVAPQQRLSSFRITGVVLDNKDLAWIGMEGALATFDGTNTRFFSSGGSDGSLPSTDVRCLLSDHNQTVWFGTAKGLCTYSRYNVFKSYPERDGNTVCILQLAETSDHELVIMTDRGYYRVADESVLELIPTIRHDPLNPERMAPDHDGGLWILSPTGFVHYNRSFEETLSIPAPGEGIDENLDAIQVKDELWVLQGRTLTCLDLRDGTQMHLHRLTEDYPINFIFYDGTDILIQSLRHGIQVYNPETHRFKGTDIAYLPATPSRTDISTMSIDRLGNLWVGYEHYGIYCISEMQRRIEMQNDGILRKRTKGEFIGSLKHDGDGNLWGSLSHQIFRYKKYGEVLDLFEVSDLLGADAQVSLIETDGESSLWALGYNKIGICDLSRDNPEVIRTKELDFRPGHSAAREGKCVFTANRPFLYVFRKDGVLDSLRIDGTTAAYYNRNARVLPIAETDWLIICDGLACALARTGQDQTEPFIVQNEGFSVEDRISDAVLDGQKVFISISRGGLYALDLRTGIIEEEPALSEQNISCMTKYSDRRMIMGTGNGIFYYDLQDKSLRNYDLYMGGNNITAFTPDGAVRDGNSIIMGSHDGCVIVPADLPFKAEQHHTSVHRMTVHDKEGAALVILPAGEDAVTLNHQNNSFDIYFGCVHYDNQPVTIEYNLEGFSSGWTRASREQIASFSKVPAGKYDFRLREVQPYTDTILDEGHLLITIKPAPWLSWPAILFYIILGGLSVWLFITSRIKSKESKLRLSVAEQKSELEHRTNEMNKSFFANIAHEFRNPLTIISGPLASLLKDGDIPPDAHKKLLSISASANSMLRLIDQMLDFNQLEMDVLRLCVGEHDITHEITRILGNFEESTNLRDISVRYDGLEDPFISLVDSDKLEKILSNLFTNALKHTPDGGIITISFDDVTGDEVNAAFEDDMLDAKRYFQVDITNNGKQIAEDKIGNVFKRYFQSSETSLHHDYGWGRGIGLYFVQRLVQVHHGAIRVFNTPDGVCFSFVIPTDRESYADAERENANVHRILQIEIPQDTHPERKSPEDLIKPVLLVVDDDIQIGQYIRSLFEDRYHVTNKYSAESALSEIDKVNPDIIISDVVMGRMSGYEFCRALKSDLTYSHIPFILLTAKTDVEDSVSGLECGANAYVTKPFSAEYLSALVDSLRKNMENLRSYLNQTTEATLAEGNLSEQDRNFINDLYKLMDKHLSEADLSVTTICEELRISRSKFNYKLKGLTGSTPGAFFRHYKLNLAAKMLKEGRHNVSEIADMMGFASISNFSASFKKMFGVPPKDYK